LGQNNLNKIGLTNDYIKGINIKTDGTTEITDDLLFSTHGKRWRTGTLAHVSGTWAVGDIVWNASPSASEEIGWVCVTAGIPGTWKSFAAISL